MTEHYYQISKPKFSGEQWKSGQVLSILYPVYIHKMTCAVKNEREMNVFQDSIFRLVVSGCLNPDEIAQLLNLDKQLVLWILQTELINSRGLLDDNWKITEQGQKYLNKNDNDDTELRTIWAFQDGLTGDWLPRFSYALEPLEVEFFDDKGLPVFLLNRESGKKEKPIRLSFIHSQTQSLDFSEVLGLPSKEYLSDLDFAKRNGNTNHKQAHIRKIVATPNTAQQAWLYAYVFTHTLSQKSWLVSDPFGLKDAVKWLRKPISEHLDKNTYLASQIAQMLGQNANDKLTPAQYLNQIDEQAKLQLLAEYPWSDKVPNATYYLLNILKLKKQLELANYQHDIDNLLIQSQNLIECILKYWIAQYPVNKSRLPNRNTWHSIDKKQMANFFQYIPIVLPNDVQEILLRQKANDVFSALFGYEKSMKATLFAVLLSTFEHSNHPILQYSDNELQFKKLLELADKRNSVGHATTQKITKIDKKESLFWVDFTVNWVKLFGQSI